MRANGSIGSDYTWVEEKVGSTRKEVGFHGYIAVIVRVIIQSLSALSPFGLDTVRLDSDAGNFHEECGAWQESGGDSSQ